VEIEARDIFESDDQSEEQSKRNTFVLDSIWNKEIQDEYWGKK